MLRVNSTPEVTPKELALINRTFLTPKERDRSSNLNSREHVILVDDDLLGLDEVGDVALVIDAARLESCSWHEPSSSANQQHLEGGALKGQ